MNTDLLRIKADITFERFRQTVLRYADELKFDPSQPRVPAGTREGGRWAAQGGSGGKPRLSGGLGGGLARRAAMVAATNPELAGAAAAAAAMPAAAAAVGVSRAAGLYDHYKTGQAITPFMHIPYDDPLQVELAAGRAEADDRQREHVAKVCSQQYDNDIDRCGPRGGSRSNRTREEEDICCLCSHRYDAPRRVQQSRRLGWRDYAAIHGS